MINKKKSQIYKIREQVTCQFGNSAVNASTNAPNDSYQKK